MELEFRPINFQKDKDIAIAFRADSFFASFGDDLAFWGNDRKGDQRYIDWLLQKDRKKFGAFHIWLGNEIIGQMELALFNEDESWGYINLYYLKPEYRGKGYSQYLDDFAVNFLSNLGVKKAKLSVSPTNSRALNFYKKNGWIDRGPREFKGRVEENKNVVHFMEKYF